MNSLIIVGLVFIIIAVIVTVIVIVNSNKQKKKDDPITTTPSSRSNPNTNTPTLPKGTATHDMCSKALQELKDEDICKSLKIDAAKVNNGEININNYIVWHSGVKPYTKLTGDLETSSCGLKLKELENTNCKGWTTNISHRTD